MPAGDSFPVLVCSVSAREAELIDWHLDNGTPSPWLADRLAAAGLRVGTTTVKEYRRRVARQPLTGLGRPRPELTEALESRRREMEDARARAIAPRVLVADIERVPGIFRGEFWDLKSWMNRRIRHEHVETWPRTICLAWKWVGENATTVSFAAEWQDDDLVQTTWDLYDQADIVVGHNLRRFDTPKLRNAWALAGRADPSPWQTVDTLTIARDRLGMEDNTLDSLCRLFDIPHKVDHYDAKVAWRAVGGHAEDQARLAAYNMGDVIATEALYLRFRDLGLIPGHPVMAPGMEGRCRACGGGDLEPMGKPVIPGTTLAYPAFRCRDCGTQQRGRTGTPVTSYQGVKS